MKNCSIILPVVADAAKAGQCLESLAKNTDPGDVEIIVATNPETLPEGFTAPPGLPGKVFQAPAKKNWAELANLGAEQASGRFLAFVSENITFRSGWLDSLLQDLAQFPEIAGAAPMLVSQVKTPLGPIMLGPGLALNPFGRLASLYQGIPAASPLAGKRRFFQAVTPYCLVLPARLFRDKGGFAHNLPFNLLTIPLAEKGKTFSVNPSVKAVCSASLTDFRPDALPPAMPGELAQDWTSHLEKDGLLAAVSPWLVPEPRLLARMPERPMDFKSLAAALVRRPYWEKGWTAILEKAAGSRQKASLSGQSLLLFPSPARALPGFALAAQSGDKALLQTAREIIASAFVPSARFLEKAKKMLAACQQQGLSTLAEQLAAWIGNFPEFREKVYLPFVREWFNLAEKAGITIDYRDLDVWQIWLEAVPATPTAGLGQAFSIVMPVYNPDPAHLRAAIDSVISQSLPHWELCIADDASTDPRIRPILQEYAQKDGRIKLVFRESNGQIAEATNSALSLATNPWIAFLDQDDLLAPQALACMAAAIQQNTQAKFLFSDEDHIDGQGRHFSPHFKNGKWDAELLAGQNFICHLMVCQAERLRKIGGLRPDFPGAQDHDLAMRFTIGLTEKEIVHVPAILYHWRTHTGSTAAKTDAKPYVRESAVKACSAWLKCRGIKATVENAGQSSWMRVRHSPPDPPPLATIIKTAASGEMARASAAIAANTSWPHEIALLPAEERPASQETGGSQNAETAGKYVAALNNAAANAAGDFLVFLGPGILPQGADWLEELAAILYRPGIGAVGGKALLQDARLLNGGYLADATGSLKELFPGARGGYYGWNRLTRTVAALDGACLAVRKKTFLAGGGLDPDMGIWAFQDFCLRNPGLAFIWQPFALFSADNVPQNPVPAAFRKKWDGKLLPFNKNLLITSQGFSLAASGLAKQRVL